MNILIYVLVLADGGRQVAEGSDLQDMENALNEHDKSAGEVIVSFGVLLNNWKGINDDLQLNNQTSQELQKLHDRVKAATRKLNEYKQSLENRIVNDIPIMEADASNLKLVAEEISKTVFYALIWATILHLKIATTRELILN